MVILLRYMSCMVFIWSRWSTSLDHVVPTLADDLDHPTMQEKQVSHG
ncbi:hypothetical protein H5410_012631 [Solanum commersonii]|uniref:Uncharacterized protein n=1 Tax=Solanum commersonii TaxID=4109 RepID=A0A9J6AS63_SOLCO|nr:hypothetical protein H5410_012631 [Solanum commersonii]